MKLQDFSVFRSCADSNMKQMVLCIGFCNKIYDIKHANAIDGFMNGRNLSKFFYWHQLKRISTWEIAWFPHNYKSNFLFTGIECENGDSRVKLKGATFEESWGEPSKPVWWRNFLWELWNSVKIWHLLIWKLYICVVLYYL